MRVVRLARRPSGLPVPGKDLVLDNDAPDPQPSDLEDGQVLVLNRFLALDPAMRGWMRDAKSYLPPVQIGQVMRGSSIGQVLVSRCPTLQAGDWVNCGIELGWCEKGIARGSALRKIKPSAALPPSAYLGVLGGTGLTAYFGLLRIGQPQPMQTVVVSAAAGATGSIVCQIAKHALGCRVVGIAGGKAKCAWLKDTLGIDDAIDYQADNERTRFRARLRKACPSGVDVFFDNVGGWILEAVLKLINKRSRVVLCGSISGYNATVPPPGPSSYINLIATSSRMEGFILLDYASEYDEAYAQLTKWVEQGKLRFVEERIAGLGHAAAAMLKLFGAEGGNKGRLVVDIHADSKLPLGVAPQESRL